MATSNMHHRLQLLRVMTTSGVSFPSLAGRGKRGANKNALATSRYAARQGRFFSSSSSTTTQPSSKDDETPPTSAFEILGIPERFAIDQRDMKKKYLALMSRHHPDRNYHRGLLVSSTTPDDDDDEPQKEDEDGQQTSSADISRAYEELAAPHTRAAHLMALRGRPVTESLSQSVVGTEFLLQIMEIRERVDELASGGGSDDDDDFRPLLQENDDRIAETCRELENALEKNDLDRALEMTARLQYWNRVTETIRGKMQS